MTEKTAIRTIYPSCSLCRGKGIIDIEGIITIKCPACYYEGWTAKEGVNMLLDKHDADRIRIGLGVRHRTARWKVLERKV